MNIETKTVNHFGTDHTYITKPEGFQELWTRITGKKTVTNTDLAQLHELARAFGSGLATMEIK